MEKYKVLVSDKMTESGLTPLFEAENISVDIRTDLTPEQLISEIVPYHALLVRSATKVTADVIKAGENLSVIGRAGVGVDNIDIEAATAAGVIVVNAPTGNVVAAAEHTVAMLLALARNIPGANAHVHNGQWKKSAFIGTEVRDKVLGLIGLGRIAQEVAHAVQALGMKVIATDPFVTTEYAQKHRVTMVELEELLGQADFISPHVPLTDQTRYLIDAKALGRTRPGVRILNVSRGGIVDEKALAEAIQSGHVAGAALDVFEIEPLPEDSPLRGCDGIILTPHLGGSTVEAQEKVAEDVARQALEVLSGRPARYALNAPIIPPRDMDFLGPYVDLAERMGRFLQQLGAGNSGDVELEVCGALADYDSSCVKASAIKGLLEGIVDVRVNLVNAVTLAAQRGINMIERKTHRESSRYESILSLSARSRAGQSWVVRGTVMMGEPYIVAINDLWLDFPAEGNILLTSHKDQPGIIGKVGTVLAEADINISFMHVGRRRPREEAVMALGTDERIPPELLTKINEAAALNWMKTVAL